MCVCIHSLENFNCWRYYSLDVNECLLSETNAFLVLLPPLFFPFLCASLLLSSLSPSRRHSHHIRGSVQQLQYGHQGGQQHQQATGVAGSVPQHLE